MMTKISRVVISGGGTGGHIFPALAIADQIKERNSTAEILFVGALHKMEMEKVPEAGYPIIGLPIAGLQRKLSFNNFLLPFKLILSLFKAYVVLRKFKPELVIGVGGYASGPTLKIAQLMGIPTLIQEQNSFAGKTNRLLAKKAQAICVAYPNMHRFFPEDKIYITGNPLRSNLIFNNEKLKKDAATFFGMDPNKPTLFVMGGSLGAKTLNVAMRNALNELTQNEIQVLWQCGKSYQSELSSFEHTLSSTIKVFAFIQRMDYAYSLADVVVSRAGALSVSELALVGKPTILVPSPNVAEDHQTQNALSLVNCNAALMLNDSEAKVQLISVVLKLFKDATKQQQLSKSLSKLALPEASKTIVDICEKIVNS